MAATNPTKYGDALIYTGTSVPLPAVMKGDFMSWAAKRYISECIMQIRELEAEIEKNLKDIESTSRVCPPGTPGYAWITHLQTQNATFTTQIKELESKIQPK